MRNLRPLFSLFMVVGLVVALASCGSDDGESLEEKQRRLLTSNNSKTWQVDAVNLSASTPYDFSGEATITFNSNGTYTLTGNDLLPRTEGTSGNGFNYIPASGKWQFTDTENFDDIKLNENIDLAIVSITESKLVAEYAGAAPKETDEATVTVTLSPVQ